MLFKRFQKDPYVLTRPHPADQSVRLTDVPEGLGAIKRGDVRAVIWERSLTDELKADLSTMSFGHVEGKRDIDFPRVKTSWLGTHIKTRPNPDRTLPHLLVQDIADVSEHFRCAMGLRKFVLPSFFNYVSCLNLTREMSPEKFANHVEPHRDGGMEYRLIAAYADAATNQGTVWYPSNIGEFSLQRVKRAMLKSGDPASVIKSFDERYNAQQIKVGDVLMIKGMVDGRPTEEAIIHRAPTPHIGVPRVVALMV